MEAEVLGSQAPFPVPSAAIDLRQAKLEADRPSQSIRNGLAAGSLYHLASRLKLETRYHQAALMRRPIC